MTRSPSAYCYLYEPDPRNIGKLRHNLRRFDGVFTLHESAVSDCEGVRPFSSEPTGRFGGLDAGPSMRAKARTITVQVEHVNTVLERVLSSTEIIDLLKIDTEGSEVATVRAIEPRLLARIRHIVIESRDHRMQIDGFRTEARCDAVRFTSEKLSG